MDNPPPRKKGQNKCEHTVTEHEFICHARGEDRLSGYKTKAAPTNAPAEATRVPTRLLSDKGAESAMAALELVADVGVEEVPLDAAVEAAVDAGTLLEFATTMPNGSRESAKRCTHHLQPPHAASCICVAVATSCGVHSCWRHLRAICWKAVEVQTHVKLVLAKESTT